MKVFRLLVRAVAVALALTPIIGWSKGSHSGGVVHVKAHGTKKGTYVPEHDRAASNKTKTYNRSTMGNVNLETGKTDNKSLTPKK